MKHLAEIPPGFNEIFLHGEKSYCQSYFKGNSLYAVFVDCLYRSASFRPLFPHAKVRREGSCKARPVGTARFLLAFVPSFPPLETHVKTSPCGRTGSPNKGKQIVKPLKIMEMKQIIWSNDYWMDFEARLYHQNCLREFMEDESYVITDEEWEDIVNSWLSDERLNLDREVDGVIIAFADLGLWRGRRQGYQILGGNVADILHSPNFDVEWYGDGYNIRSRMEHHDGTNHVIYRVAKNREAAERIAEKIYNLEIDEKGFRKLTRSLYPYVADIYGWKVRWRKPA